VSSDSNRFAVELTSKAAKELSKLEPSVQVRVRLAFELLRGNPRPPKSLKLANQSLYRVRVGDYRILYKILDRKLVVIVIRVAHRSEVYRT
jgi:mRNA interferase RelE/StbE